ncbi:MAG: hypothetical protein FWE40_01775 [Oscillospiraceae bacterium]|nr:hypothetical protein [Oscillospiraceae bacterium]
MLLKPLIRDTRKQINRTSGILFLVLLFGALGAGFFFVVQNILGVQGMLGALNAANEPILWFILFWATDFFMVAMVALLCYFIAGWPGVAPGLALPIYFAHFAGTPVAASEVYHAYFAAPLHHGGGANIGWLGYFFMALLCALLIKLLFAGWHALKLKAGDKHIHRKLKLSWHQLLDQVDLIVLVLIIPVASAAFTWLVIHYGVQHPASLLPALVEPLLNLSGVSVVLVGILFGLMIGLDIVGPLSMTAFAVATTAFLQGDAQLLTIYGAAFVTIGWSPLAIFLLSKLTKRVHADNDELNLAISGPINAFFENMKLTVAFAAPFAMRNPLAIIPGLMTGSAITGGLVALFGIVNQSYLTDYPRFGGGLSMAELLQRGDFYLSFTLPFRSGGWLDTRIPLALCILAGAIAGGAVMFFLRRACVRGQKKRGTYLEANGDIVLDMRNLAKERFEALRGAKS